MFLLCSRAGVGYVEDIRGRSGGIGFDCAVCRDDRGLGATVAATLTQRRTSGSEGACGAFPLGEKRDGGRQLWVRRGHHRRGASPLKRESAPGGPLAAPSSPVIVPVHDLQAVGKSVQCRICPPPRPLRLFAAEGIDQDPEAGGTRQGGPPAGAGADRYRQHVRGAGILRQTGRLWHPADHRLRARGRFRRPCPMPDLSISTSTRPIHC